MNNNKLEKRLAEVGFMNFLKVKTFVTLILTIVFAILALEHQIDPEFLTIYTVVISFYFGTQCSKQSEKEKNKNDSK